MLGVLEKQDAYHKEIAQLRARIEELEEELYWEHRGEKEAQQSLLATRLGVPKHLAAVLRLFAQREFVSHEALKSLARRRDSLEDKYSHVLVCSARHVLTSRGIEIQTVWAHGYRINRENQQRLRAFLEE